MSMNYAFGFSLFLLVLVGLNIYFFYTLNTIGTRSPKFNVPSIKLEFTSSVFKDIYDYLNYLPSIYKTKNPKFLPIQNSLLISFNSSHTINTQDVWSETESDKLALANNLAYNKAIIRSRLEHACHDNKFNSLLGLMHADIKLNEESLFPHINGAPGKILHAIQTSPIALVDNAPKGTQLKLLLLLEGKQKIYFKPKRYNLNYVVNGNIYGGFDRHNSEVFAYYLAMVLNLRWIPPSVIRRIHIHKDIVPVATAGLKRTMVKNDSGSLCIYGKCFYCKINETVCPDSNGEIEGAAILYLDRQFKIHKSPWRRSYSTRKMEWETDNDFCKKVKGILSAKRLLNLIDVAIFDFLIQNGDRHRYEVYKDQIVLLDNGKGLGNAMVDELDILAPLYQCCVLTTSTWQNLEMISGGSLTDTIKKLGALRGHTLATEEHFKAVERRLLKVYATVQYCIGKHGRSKVFKNGFY